MNILRSWLFKLSTAGTISFGSFEYFLHNRERPPFLAALREAHSMSPSRKYILFSVTSGRNTYFDDSVVKLINGFNYIEVFEKDNDDTIYCVFNASKKLQFFTNHVHEGLLAALVDNISGFQATILNKKVVATAKLSLKYEEPILTDNYYLMEMKQVKIDERRSNILGTFKRLDNSGVLDKGSAITSETLMVNIDWRGLDVHNKNKKEESER